MKAATLRLFQGRRSSKRLYTTGVALWLCALAFLPASQAQDAAGTKTIIVSSGQQLADEISAFGVSGGNVTIVLEADMLDMRGVDFHEVNNSLPGRFGEGNLTLQGRPRSAGQLNTVIDAAMRQGLVPAFKGPAELHLQNITIVNNCEIVTDLNRQGTLLSSAYYFRLFLKADTEIVSYSYFTAYGRRSDLAAWLYIAIVRSVPFPEVQARTSQLVQEQTASQATVSIFNTYYYSSTVPLLYWNNMTLKVLDDPNDQLINSMRANGTLMPPQYCNGTLLPEPLATAPVDRDIGPLYLASNTPDFLWAFKQAAVLSGQQDAAKKPPVIVLHGGVENLTEAVLPDPVTFTGDILMWGAPVTAMSSFLAVTIDFNRRSGVIVNTNTTSDIIIAAHILVGFASAIPDALPGMPQPTIPTVFPLSAFKTARGQEYWTTNAPVKLWATNLVVPQSDYLAILLLALKGTADISSDVGPDIVSLAAQLAPGVYVIDVYQYGDGFQNLFLRNFTAWGIDSSILILSPETPLTQGLSDSINATMMAANSTSGSKGLSSTQRAGVIAGSVIGGTAFLVLAIAGIAAAIVRHRRSDKADECASVASVTVKDPSKLPDSLKQIRSDTQSPGLGSMPLRTAHGPSTVPSLMRLVQDSEFIRYQKAGFDTLGELEPTSSDNQTSSRESLGLTATATHLTPSSNNSTLSPVNETITEEPEGLEEEGGVVMLSELTVRDATAEPSGPASLIRRHRLTAGRDADKVVIKDILGSGAWGTVYAGEWRGVPVAVKTMVFNWSGAAAFMGMAGNPSTPAARREARAIMEAAIAASVGHHNVVATYCYDIKPVGAAKSTVGKGSLEIEEMFTDDLTDSTAGTGSEHSSSYKHKEYKMYLIQELCACTLTKVLEAGVLHRLDTGQPETVALLGVLLDIARGLEYLHGKGIVHGDLKPDNVLLKTAANTPMGVVAKLADFGLSTQIQEGKSHCSGFNAGTPFFVAPEVIKQFRTSPASDLYSFGVMMWQLWVAQAPYVTNEHGEIVWNPAFGTFEHMPAPPGYVELFKKCLSSNPRDRPTAQDAVQQLLNLIVHNTAQ